MLPKQCTLINYSCLYKHERDLSDLHRLFQNVQVLATYIIYPGTGSLIIYKQFRTFQDVGIILYNLYLLVLGFLQLELLKQHQNNFVHYLLPLPMQSLPQ